MKVLSLFDGMSCGQIALKELGIKVSTFYASEIDKHAIKTTLHNFPNTVQLGDVTKWKEWDIDWENIELVLGGSPCQGFSFAGKQLAFDDPRSALFFVFVEIWRYVKERNPKALFLLENVRMKKEHEVIISNYMEVAPLSINSNLVSAQNRHRLYWTNIANKPYGFFGDLYCTIPQPEDRMLFLRDILEEEVDEKYYLSDDVVSKLITHRERHKESGHGFWAKFHGGNDKMQAIKVGGKGIDDLVVDFKEPIQLNSSIESGGKQPYQQNRVYDANGISPALMAEMSCGSYAVLIPEATKKGYVEINLGECFDFENPKSTTRRGRKMEEKSNCLMAKETDFMRLTPKGRIRRLTPTECARLQTIPDWYDMDVVSDTQKYKMLGNGWTVEVIKHILSYMK